MKSKGDPNLYVKIDKNGYIALICLHVDDLIITIDSSTLIEGIKQQLS